MKKTIQQRQVADKTRDRILKAAGKLFAENGFSGTSTQSIAKAARVNEALIFHHFKSKQELWKLVKATIVDALNLQPLSLKPKTLAEFLAEVIEQRLQAFLLSAIVRCPDVVFLVFIA